eukprot:356951-Chlamydomonas_euryale.AAC.1
MGGEHSPSIIGTAQWCGGEGREMRAGGDGVACWCGGEGREATFSGCGSCSKVGRGRQTGQRLGQNGAAKWAK